MELPVKIEIKKSNRKKQREYSLTCIICGKGFTSRVPTKQVCDAYSECYKILHCPECNFKKDGTALCSFHHHKENLRIRKITNCDCYICEKIKENEGCKPMIQEEENYETVITTEEWAKITFQKLLRKWRKRKQRGGYDSTNPKEEAKKELLEILTKIIQAHKKSKQN